MTYTKGPWTLQKTESFEFILDKPNVKLEFTNHISNQDATVANAHLIAAAPEMLEALESVSCGCNVLYKCEPQCHMHKVEAVINKAKGGARE